MKINDKKILVVDDEPAIRKALEATLTNFGFTVLTAGRGEEALGLIRTTPIRAVLMDINMPGMSGIQACRQIRQADPHISILMLTVRDRESDKVEALDAGADDYVTKPFHVRELGARLRAAMRRSLMAEPDKGKHIRIGEIEVDLDRRTASKSGTLLRLTPKEFDLLYYLMSKAGKPVRHAELLAAVWGPEYRGELEYLRTFVYQIRRKIEGEETETQYITTEPYVGYRFVDPDLMFRDPETAVDPNAHAEDNECKHE